MARASLDGHPLELELGFIQRGRDKFDAIFDPAAHEKAREKGMWRMSWKALQAALFINCYRDEPILQGPHQLLTHIIDVDELMARWRYRHALMVQRMVGMSMGTGGSSGYGYLMETLEKHRIFTDLFSLTSYLIPGNMIPPLPEKLKAQMSYSYGKDAA
jgi:tryptophan 2,3-dioxygenase